MLSYEERLAEAECRHREAMDRVASITDPHKQKFPIGSRVRIAKDLGASMSHFPSDRDATVKYSYAQAFGRGVYDQYCLDVDGAGQHSWYYEHQLQLLELPPIVWPRPIPVGERLPEEGVEVLIYAVVAESGFGYWLTATYSDDDWWTESVVDESSCVTVVSDSVTHWLPLPPSPMEGT